MIETVKTIILFATIIIAGYLFFEDNEKLTQKEFYDYRLEFRAEIEEIKKELETVKLNTDTLKIGQEVIYKNVKKNDFVTDLFDIIKK